MNPLAILYRPEDERIHAGRERQFLRRERSALRRLTLLEALTNWGTVASDAEVAAHDARVAAAEKELMA